MVTLALKYTHVEPGESGAIWMSETAPMVLNGDLFFSTANGPFNPAPNGNDYGDSVIKLSTVPASPVHEERLCMTRQGEHPPEQRCSVKNG